MSTFAFDNSYARLPDRFYARVAPTPVSEPQMVQLNEGLAQLLEADIAELNSPRGAQLLSGNALPEGADPIALAYAGHQFGSFVPQLGDGRAILLGEVVGRDGARRDVQLKGAGRTPFSRGGDGRAAVGPVIREYIVSEAMAAMGVPTTRALAAVTTGEPVFRGRRLPGAVLTRVAASHIRVGTFQYFAVRRDHEALALLTEYALRRHYPDSVNGERPALVFLERVIAAQADLVSRWLGLGFVHGVMNTDNTSVSGETIDYGPCAFLDEYDPRKTFSSIDELGRYAFGNQPNILQWNLARLAETLLPLISDDEEEAIRLATERLDRFPDLFNSNYAAVLRAKIGFVREQAGDEALTEDVLRRLAADAVDYTVFFRALCTSAANTSADAAVTSLFSDPQGMAQWLAAWRQRLALEERSPETCARAMRLVNPAYIPRNHRIEQAIDAAADHGDFQPFYDLVRALARPYEEQPEFAALAEPPTPEERVQQTFCGT